MTEFPDIDKMLMDISYCNCAYHQCSWYNPLRIYYWFTTNDCTEKMTFEEVIRKQYSPIKD